MQGLGIKSQSGSPQLDTIWLAHEKKALVHGCAEYGRRLEKGLPTYLDTLPELSVLVERRGGHIWVDLLNAETCEGGKPYKPVPIQGKFAIKAGTQNLQVYLKKGGMRARVALETTEELVKQETVLSKSNRVEVAAKVRHAGT